MPTYPTLTVPPNYPLKESPEDRAIRNKSEAGYVQTRYRSTRQILSFDVVYSMLDGTDKGALKTFYDTVETVDSFTWTHPYTSVSYTVRFDTVPAFDLVDNEKWECRFTLRQV